MSSKNRAGRKDPAYIREQGTKGENVKKQRTITFSLSKHIVAEGQSIEQWEELGLLAQLLTRIKFMGQLTVHEIRQKKFIKEYHKVEFPPNSKFTKPKHIPEVVWAVMHITEKSKEVVAGYIEDDVFYIVFFDKDHKFWPTSLKNT